MASGNPNIKEYGANTRWQPGQSGNPTGPKPGYKHLSTYIQEMMDDPEFEAQILEGYALTDFKGAPATAIVRVAIKKAIAGDVRFMEWLARHGYSMAPEPEQPPDRPIVFGNEVPVS